MKITRALISVSDKTGVADFARGLSKLGVEIISTGGTATFLKKLGVKIREVSDVTGFPEMLDGRVKTLHPVIHAGILAKRKEKKHMDTLKKHGIKTIDLLVCNLYPFEEIIKKPKVSLEDVIENIDIGGPSLIRAGAKNYQDVIVLTNPKQYNNVLKTLKSKKDLDKKEREKLAIEAFTHTAQYDAIISKYLRDRLTDEMLPENNNIAMRKIQEMRYGENPHQKGAFYRVLPEITEPCISNAVQLQRKKLSYNNILDSDCAIECIKEFPDKPACVIIKHATPCGVATSDDLLHAWKDAYATDTYSPFGGIVAFNRKVEKNVANELSNLFLEVIIAPSFTREALALFGKKKNLRLLQIKGLDKKIKRHGIEYRSVVGGVLAQERDICFSDKKDWRIVTKNKPSREDLISMDFAVRCVKHIKSNSVVFVKGTRTVGIGGGQTSRVDATWIATYKGKENIKGSIMASDAFFPFRDAVDVAAKAGVKAIIQPGGSIRDEEVIKAADEHGISMVFSGQRYFRH
ncbi:MAG: bifunctional phosphoribosylaminoimidazolecarboxamide formyltransferase/IMP cyclohydrolase [Candidatus Thermoplasmatota archaeon]|jgi:phosphoribosylaminoimidazolecarboxamide formyltransferase/IMP cyclohydrolase|nr:bifunctional phosphoribosylaminoimidazolecarboxamide formyltransferase/IMP cyclohydrolase [Candidatus Thermoplasmatota archaeon]